MAEWLLSQEVEMKQDLIASPRSRKTIADGLGCVYRDTNTCSQCAICLSVTFYNFILNLKKLFVRNVFIQFFYISLTLFFIDLFVACVWHLMVLIQELARFLQLVAVVAVTPAFLSPFPMFHLQLFLSVLFFSSPSLRKNLSFGCRGGR